MLSIGKMAVNLLTIISFIDKLVIMVLIKMKMLIAHFEFNKETIEVIEFVGIGSKAGSLKAIGVTFAMAY